MEHLLGLVGLLIEKKDTKLRKAIPGSERLVLTLRFSASGDSQVSLTYLFQIGKTSVNRIVSETREPIIKVHLNDYLFSLTTEEHCKRIAHNIEELWQFPHVIGDWKLAVAEVPARSSTLYHDCKWTFSIALSAICRCR